MAAKAPDSLARIVVAIFAASLAYAIVRYNLCKGVPWVHLPMYVANKAVAMTALALLGLAQLSRRPAQSRQAGLAAAIAAALHVVVSQVLLAPAYYPKFYASDPDVGGFSLVGELSLLTGALGSVVLLVLVWPKTAEALDRRPGALPWLVRATLAAVALHSLFYGWGGWLKPGTWPCGLPPITLLSFLFAAIVLVVSARNRA